MQDDPWLVEQAEFCQESGRRLRQLLLDLVVAPIREEFGGEVAPPGAWDTSLYYSHVQLVNVRPLVVDGRSVEINHISVEGKPSGLLKIHVRVRHYTQTIWGKKTSGLPLKIRKEVVKSIRNRIITGQPV